MTRSFRADFTRKFLVLLGCNETLINVDPLQLNQHIDAINWLKRGRLDPVVVTARREPVWFPHTRFPPRKTTFQLGGC